MIDARRRRRAAGALCFVALAACAETTVDPVDTTGPATSTTIPSGTPEELLARLLVEVSALSEHVVDNEGDDAALARIEALWAVAAPQIEEAHPDLAPDFGAALALVHRSVEPPTTVTVDGSSVEVVALPLPAG